MIPFIGSSGAEQPTRRLYAPEEEVPESGIYQAVHESKVMDTVVFLRGAIFPACEDCGKQVRYKPLRTAPYIFEDKDFQ